MNEEARQRGEAPERPARAGSPQPPDRAAEQPDQAEQADRSDAQVRLEVQVVRRQILRRLPGARSDPLVRELGLELVKDRCRDAFLCSEHVVNRRVHGFRPQIAAVHSVDELYCQTYPVTRSTHAASDDQRRFDAIDDVWFV